MTLVEVLIGVAILGILAAIAIPRMQEARNRSRRAEAQTNVRGIRTALFGASFSGSSQVFTGAGPSPRTDSQLDKKAVPWVSDAGFDFLGYAPDGDVRCNYTINLEDLDNMFVRGACDVDNDDELAEVLMTATENPYLATPNEVY